MMNLTLQYLDAYGTIRQMWIRPHEMATVGASRHADYVLTHDPELDQVHFLVQMVDQAWVIEAVGDRPVQVNRRYIRASKLEHNDSILAGSTDFTVLLPKLPDTPGGASETATFPVKATVPEETDTQIDDAPVLEYAVSALKGGVHQLRVIEGRSFLRKALIQSSNGCETYAVWNRKAFGDTDAQLTGWTNASDDLFSSAPEEIRGVHSLEFGRIQATQPEFLKELEPKILDSDTFVILISRAPSDAVLQAKKISWAWFAKPTLLQFHLQNGSETLLRLLMDGLDSILVSKRGSKDLWLYTKSSEIQGMARVS
jgi:hypothetical protein